MGELEPPKFLLLIPYYYSGSDRAHSLAGSNLLYLKFTIYRLAILNNILMVQQLYLSCN
eukprot:SAG22_NODE_6690_length_822_cov_1.822960_1_plen_58_part_10